MLLQKKFKLIPLPSKAIIPIWQSSTRLASKDGISGIIKTIEAGPNHAAAEKVQK